MIIDSHTHLGVSEVSKTSITIDTILDSMDAAGITTSIVQPHPWPQENISEVHNMIYQYATAYRGKILGLASINPHLGQEFYRKEAGKCFKEYNFRGLKLHPSLHLSPINSGDSDIVFNTAMDFDVPVMIHTGFGVPFTMPSLVLPRARAFPKLKIIIAHCGEPNFAEEALILAQECENIYLETSWCKPNWIRKFVESIGSERMLFGSDLPENILSEKMKFTGIKLNGEDMESILYKTAYSLFKLYLN